MPFGKDDVAFLESMDTPTVCNVIEIVAPGVTVETIKVAMWIEPLKAEIAAA